ncbi:hypothetical protein ACP4OV_003761 [Aristida adscensionis]
MEEHEDSSSATITWTPPMSDFVLNYLTDHVASGTKTSTGFKKVHLNKCAKALYEHLKVRVTAGQISNHLRKWRNKWNKIKILKAKSGWLWDENTYTIKVDLESYTEYVQANKGDAHYLNTPLEHYHEMATIFGNSMATEDYAKGANDPLATDVMDVISSETSRDTTNTEAIEEGQTSENIRGESSGTKPSKKAKISADDDILSVMTGGLNKIGNAIEKAFAPKPEIPEDLLDNLMALPRFEETHLYHYYAHLCDRPAIARAFNRLGFSGKIIWVSKYICERNL